MPVNILMPALSPTMAEGNLVKWLKNEGDKIVAGDVIAEIETDKATMEVEAVDEGVLAKIVIPGGTDNVKVNALIAILLEEGEEASQISLINTAKASNESTNHDTTHSVAHTQKSTDVSSQTTVKPENKESTKNHDVQTTASSPSALTTQQRIVASPLARRIAHNEGVELVDLNGTGPHGRIIKVDVENFISSGAMASGQKIGSQSSTKTSLSTTSTARADDSLFPAYDEIKLSNMRKVIARRLTESKQMVPHFYLTVDIELDALLATRKEINQSLAELERISVNDCLIKAAGLALKAVPAANASYAETHVRQYHAADIAVAVAIDGGLVTPILRDADSKSLSTLSSEMRNLIAKARAGKLMPVEYQGGTFSISNLGMYGIQSFSAVINPPQGCILAIGAGEQRPVVKNGQITIATVMSCTLSVDHRVVDGAIGAEFLKHFKRYIQHPLSMLI